MIRKIFLTEWKENFFVCAAGLALCLLAAVGISLAGIGATDALRADLAEYVFAVFNAFSYVMPVLLLLKSIFSFRSYYRMAGVTEEKRTQGVLFGLFVWMALFLAAQMIFATLFDFIYFAGAPAVRGQTSPQSMLLSLRAHGVHRLLFAPSAAVTVCLVYIMYDVIRVAVVRVPFLPLKILVALIFLALYFFYHYTVYCAAGITGELADASWLVLPDSVLPVLPVVPGGTIDAVKDIHFLAAPVLNLVFLLGEILFCVFAYGFVHVVGRCKNEIE